MSGGSGGGGKSGRGGGGGGPDMTTPVEKMGLDTTIKNVYSLKQAITANEQQMAIAYNKGAEGRADRSRLRDERNALESRLTKVKDSMTRRERDGMEVITKGKEIKILGKYTGSWSPHYGPI